MRSVTLSQRGDFGPDVGAWHLSFVALLPGRLVTDTNFLPAKQSSSPSQLHHPCSPSSAAEEAMPDSLIHAPKISAGPGMRVMR